MRMRIGMRGWHLLSSSDAVLLSLPGSTKIVNSQPPRPNHCHILQQGTRHYAGQSGAGMRSRCHIGIDALPVIDAA